MNAICGFHPRDGGRSFHARRRGRAIYLLAPWGRQDVAMEPVPVGGGAFEALWRATYRRALVRQMKVQPEYFRTVTAVARRVPVFRVMRHAHPSPPAALADRIEEDLRKRESGNANNSSSLCTTLHASRRRRRS